MVDLKTVANADSGTADIVGGDDWDDMATKVNNYVNTPDFARYYIYKSGSTYYAKNGLTKVITSNSDAQALIQSVVTAATTGGLFRFSTDDFQMNAGVSIPTSATATSAMYVFQGVPSNIRTLGTSFGATASFPTGTYFFTCDCPVSSGKAGKATFRDFNMYNLNFATTNVGGIRLENDVLSRGAYNANNVGFQYLWNGLVLQGYVYFGHFDKLFFNDFNASFVGVNDIRLELSGHGDKPKDCGFMGTAITHQGQVDHSIYINAGYCHFIDTQIDGGGTGKWTVAPVAIVDGFSNVIDGIQMLDLNGTPVPDNRVGAILIDATSAKSAAPEAMDNRIINCRTGRSPTYMLAFRNNAHRNIVELAHYGATVNVDDSGAGPGNVVIVQPGHVLPSSTTPTKLVTSNSLCRIIDMRQGAKTTGTSTQSGDASTVAFNIAHNLFTTPTTWWVTPTSADAKGTPIITATSTNLVVTYALAPPTGSSNLTWVWGADIY